MNMSKFLRAVGFIALIAQGSCSAQQQPTTIRYVSNQQNLDRLTNSVVALVNPNQPFSRFNPTCSAFFVRATYLATAAHCLRRPSVIVGEIEADATIGQTVSFSTYQQWRDNYGRRTVPSHRASVVAINNDNDVALLRTSSFSSRYFLNTNSSLIPSTGSNVYTMTHPGGMPWVLSQGIVSLVEFDNANTVSAILASPSIFFGSSGGPLVDDNGNAIGIAKAIGFRQATFGLFTPINRLATASTNLLAL